MEGVVAVKIGYSKRASSTAAFALLVEGWNDLVQEGFTPEGVAMSPVQADDEVLYAISAEGDIVGAMAFQVEEDSVWINLSYVEASSRKRGVYRELFAALLKLARERNVAKITSEVATGNKIMQLVLRRMGRAAVSVTYELTLAA